MINDITKRLVTGSPEDFEAKIQPATAEDIMVFNSLYGAPFAGNWNCSMCGERNHETSLVCDECGTERET
jgi:hypothetical protein